jgi:glutamate carboxypeptidase
MGASLAAGPVAATFTFGPEATRVSPMRIPGPDQAVFDHVERSAGALINRAVAWAEIASGSTDQAGLGAMLDALEHAAAPLDGATERLATKAGERVEDDGALTPVAYLPALRLRKRPDAPVQVLLTGHFDTVYGPDADFRTVRRREDGALNGPGIADMKGGISVLLGALEAFETHPARDRLGWTVLLSPDEEIGSPGSAPLLAEAAGAAHVGLTYEPALPDGRLAGARKGSGNFHLVVRGRSAHAGRAFAEGRNAVAGAALLAARLHALNGRRDGVTVNIARVSGGSALNVVPDRAVVRLNVRVPDADAARWIETELRALQPPFEGLALSLHGGFTRPPKPMDAAQVTLFDAVSRAGAALGQSIESAPSGGVCEGNNLHAAGLPNIDTLGVRGGDIHSPDEFAWPASFGERAALSALILCRLATGEIDGPAIRRLRAEAG